VGDPNEEPGEQLPSPALSGSGSTVADSCSRFLSREVTQHPLSPFGLFVNDYGANLWVFLGSKVPNVMSRKSCNTHLLDSAEVLAERLERLGDEIG
jgi:hypothetical protein